MGAADWEVPPGSRPDLQRLSIIYAVPVLFAWGSCWIGTRLSGSRWLAFPCSLRPGFSRYPQVDSPLGLHPPGHSPSTLQHPTARSLSKVLPTRDFRTGQV